MTQPLYTRRKQAAAAIGVSPRTLDRLRGQGLLVGEVKPDGFDPLFKTDSLAVLPAPVKEDDGLTAIEIKRHRVA